MSFFFNEAGKVVLRGWEVFCFFVLRDVEVSVFKGEFWNTGEGREDWAVALFLKHARARRAGFLFRGLWKVNVPDG